MQITKFNIKGMKTMVVYISSNHSIRDTWKELDSILEDDQTLLITGDFNICTQKDKSNEISSNLAKNGFQLMIQDAGFNNEEDLAMDIRNQQHLGRWQCPSAARR